MRYDVVYFKHPFTGKNSVDTQPVFIHQFISLALHRTSFISPLNFVLVCLLYMFAALLLLLFFDKISPDTLQQKLLL